jgi:hypothetical protein
MNQNNSIENHSWDAADDLRAGFELKSRDHWDHQRRDREAKRLAKRNLAGSRVDVGGALRHALFPDRHHDLIVVDIVANRPFSGACWSDARPKGDPDFAPGKPR